MKFSKQELPKQEDNHKEEENNFNSCREIQMESCKELIHMEEDYDNAEKSYDELRQKLRKMRPREGEAEEKEERRDCCIPGNLMKILSMGGKGKNKTMYNHTPNLTNPFGPSYLRV